MSTMNAFGAPGVSGKDHRDRDSSDKSHNTTNTSCSIPQPIANTHDTSPSYSQDCTSIHRQSPWQKIATSSKKPPSRTCSSFPQGQDSSRRELGLDPELQAADPDPQRNKPTFALGTASREASCNCSVCQAKGPSTNSYLSTTPINKTSTGDVDNSINNANNPDNRVNNGHIEIGNSFSSVSAATTAYANDITHFHIGAIQYNFWMPPEYYNPGLPPTVWGMGRAGIETGNGGVASLDSMTEVGTYRRYSSVFIKVLASGFFLSVLFWWFY